MENNLTLVTVRRHCLDCAGGDNKAVLWCPCDGVNSTACEFWPFRFGFGPAKIARKYHPALVTPAAMPPASVNLDSLPGTATAAAAYFRQEETARNPLTSAEALTPVVDMTALIDQATAIL